MADKDFKVKTGLDLPAPLPVLQGGTGQTTLNNALNAMLPLQTGNSGKVLSTDGTNTVWAADASGVSTAGGSSITVASGSTIPLTIQNNGTGNSFVVNDVASDTTPFVIDPNGNVGIGISTPANKLVIADGVGEWRFSPSNITVGSSSAGHGTTFVGGIPVDITVASGGAKIFLGGESRGDSLISSTAFYTNSTERMRIDSLGNVFIGTNVTIGQNTGGLTIQGKDIELITIMKAY